jgi:hypothetical protein
MSVEIGERRFEMALGLCLELVDAVRCADYHRVGRTIDLLDHPAALVALAAMVDDSKTLTELLAWHTEVEPKPYRPPPLAPCGTHAAHNRHKKRGEPPCGQCVMAERVYQRLRMRQRR